MSSKFEERLYFDAEADAFVVENPKSHDRVRQKSAAFQDLFSVGTRRVEVVLTGVWYDVDAQDVFSIKLSDDVRYVGEVPKTGILAWWPDGTVRLLQVYGSTTQRVYYKIAEPDRQLHEHYQEGGKTYRALAGDCKFCSTEIDLEDLMPAQSTE